MIKKFKSWFDEARIAVKFRTRNPFFIFSVIYGLRVAAAIYISVRYSELFVFNTGFGGNVLDLARLLVTVLALFFTVYFFQLQTLTNFLPINFLRDIGGYKSKYYVFGYIGLNVILLCLIGTIYINECTRYNLIILPYIILTVGGVIYILVRNYFSTLYMLTPKGMALIIEKQIDRYIELSRISLEEYIGISKRSQGDKEAIIKHRLQKKSSFILSAQFGLFQVFDVLYKLEQQKELGLARQTGTLIVNSFHKILDTYDVIYITGWPNTTTEIDRFVLEVYESFEKAVLMFCDLKHRFFITDLIVCHRICVSKSLSLKYADEKGAAYEGEDHVFDTMLAHWIKFCNTIIDTGNEEAIFQLKKGTQELIEQIIKNDNYEEDAIQTDRLYNLFKILNKIALLRLSEVVKEVETFYSKLLATYKQNDKATEYITEGIHTHY